MSNPNESNAPSATTPLLDSDAQRVELTPLRVSQPSPSGQLQPVSTPVVITATPVLGTVASRPQSPNNAPTLSNEYRFVHQRIPAREGNLRFVLPGLLIAFQLAFIVIFSIFGSYSVSSRSGDLFTEQISRKYPMFEDLHAIALLGFGFIMTFLKRYGYGSVGFNLLLVAFVVQWALIVRGWIEWNYNHNGMFKIELNSLVIADFTAIAVLVSFGALLGKTTLTQLVALAFIEVIVQSFNEYLNIYIVKAYDVGRSVYVHLFGALFGLAASKLLHMKGIKSSKQASVYHSDLFSLIGTLFLWVYYPSFNGILANTKIANAQVKAIINTYCAISASCVITFAVSSLVGKGKISALHVQHATIAGGIAIGSVADLNVQIYVALIVGSLAGLLSTVGYHYIDPCLTRILKLHDTCSVQSLHGIPGLIAAILGAIFAACSSLNEYSTNLYEFYPARAPVINTTDYLDQRLSPSQAGNARTALEQAGWQLIALSITAGFALVGGAITGLILRLPLFEQLSEEVEMFDDEAQWVTPDDYALKLTFASSTTTQPIEQPRKEDSKV